tara:strand:+ start:82 stop:471 length:390 start_codon:yes stop_codon:yes gene_type:complete
LNALRSLLTVCLLTWITYQLVRLAFTVAGQLAQDKVLGTLGIILAGIGIALEAYQYVVQQTLEPAALVPFQEVAQFNASVQDSAATIGVIYFYGVFVIAVVAIVIVRPPARPGAGQERGLPYHRVSAPR